MQKQGRRGWDLVVTSSDGEIAGWYSGGRWRAGGTVALTTGTEVSLRRAADLHWKLRTPGTKESFVEIASQRRDDRLAMTLTIMSVPVDVSDLHLLALTACAVVILERTLPVLAVGG